MPPKKGKKAAPAAPPLDGCTVALSGAFTGHTQSSLETDFINALGATLAKSVTKSTTHLVTNDTDFEKPSAKVKQAKSYNLHIVKFAWLEDCLNQNKRLSEDDYSFDNAASAPSPPAAVANGSKKRSADADGSQSQPQKKGKVASGIDDQTKSHLAVKSVPKVKTEIGEGQTNIATSSDINVPVDETCPLGNYTIYIDPSGVIYDAALNQTNAGANNNKFYRVQLLRNAADYKTWTRWGRVGERGQSAILGDGSLDDAISQFQKKFKDKSGLSWENRGDAPKPKKYTFVERSYVDDSDDEKEAKPAGDGIKKEEEEAPESKLDPAIQDLMELIFNQQYFATAMQDLNYDVNKLPLGKLGKQTITRGYQALKDLSDLFNDASLAQSQHGTSYVEAVEQLSNAFYSLIPHAFGRNRPPVIQNDDMLKKEVELLDSLSDMKEASNILKRDSKDAERINVLDQQFRGLNLDEMTPLKKSSEEFVELKNYLVNTRGATHNANYQVGQIFRIERQGEKGRFDSSPFAGPPRDRRLLWHGSRATNFGGILSQGLRIAPPEAPVSGYMFGKGIYLADMSSKSANYCCPYISNGHALLLLCEAELGDPIQTLTNASYNAGEDAKAKGMLSTYVMLEDFTSSAPHSPVRLKCLELRTSWGQGTTGPSKWKDAAVAHPSLKGIKMPDTSVLPGPTKVPNAGLLYNEFIAYDVAQVRLRYLFQVRM